MTSAAATLPPNLFDRLFAEGPDPWHFKGSWYEARKRDLLLASLPRAHYASAFEPGCAAGFLSEKLAPRCDSLLAWDGARDAVGYAAERLAPYPHARVAHGRVPDQWPEGAFDLIVLSEFLYYLEEHDIARLAQCCRGSLLASGSGATVVGCHWLHPFGGSPLGGARAHDILHGHLQIPRVAQWRDADFCLEVWSTQPQSVAQGDGRRN